MRYINKCLQSVLETNYSNFEVLLVDNGSTDGSIAHIENEYSSDPRVKIILNHINYGFAKGNNVGVKISKGDYIVFLNNDTEVEKNWLRELVRILESDPNIGAAQSKLLLLHNPELIDTCGHRLTSYGFLVEIGAGKKDGKKYDHTFDILGAKGASMIIRRKVLEETALVEETDLCWRIWLRGYRVIFAPSSRVHHAVGGVSREESAKNSNLSGWRRIQLYYWYRNLMVTLLKNLGFKRLGMMFSSYFVLSFLDSLIGSIMNSNVHKVISFLKAILSILKNLRSIWRKRVRNQSLLRIKRDSEFLPKIIVKLTLPEILRRKS
jgi:GT2 family glycosyltransferase